jgi:YidC/Oxa1 family membrane protein insertase
MKTRTTILILLAVYSAFCFGLVWQTGLFQTGGSCDECILLQGDNTQESSVQPADNQTRRQPQMNANDQPVFVADHSSIETVVLGSKKEKSGYKFRLELTTKGAAVKSAILSGYNDRDYENPKPLKILSSIGEDFTPLANKELVFVDSGQKLPLNLLYWELKDKTTDANSQTAVFEALVKNQDNNQPILKITKTYKLVKDSFHLFCDLNIQNLTGNEHRVRWDMAGPGGLIKEGVRSDYRKIVAGFRNDKGDITSTRKAINDFEQANKIDKIRMNQPGQDFLWIASVNKYFAGILVPVSGEGESYPEWISKKYGMLYNPDSLEDTKDENIGTSVSIKPNAYKAAGDSQDSRKYEFILYLGPKDKPLFDDHPLYKSLGFVQTIDFLTCCCPSAILSPLAFGILAVMEWMYGFIGNYGIVIIILVFIIRTLIHPLTKKSQVSMSKFSKLAPKIEEIKKKYANNKTELNKRMMELYKEQGASPVMGMLPMLIQMPIWISLYSAIYASVNLRGAPFLPFWITDLSAPDALFRFSGFDLPLFGVINSFNLLPILMGFAFFLQQKLMPNQAAAQSTNPQMAQQQKMMKIIFPLMFPLILYKAPSGLNLYIMASTFAGVIEQYVIRKHIREKEEQGNKNVVPATSKTGGKAKKKKPKPFKKF